MKYHKIEKGVYTIDGVVSALKDSGAQVNPTDENVDLYFSYDRKKAT